MAETEQSVATTSSETWSTIVFWVVIAAFAAFWYFREDRADVVLDVSTQRDLVSGMVTFGGVPVRGGVVHLVVSEAGSKRYLAGATLPVGDDGKFTLQDHQALGITEQSGSLRLSAAFRGTLVEKEKGDSKVKPLFGETVLYLNSTAPLGERFLLGIAISALVLLVFQLVLFTGDLGQRKARWLFVLMYFFTFFSLALPIAVSLVVAHNPYLVDAMRASPIGLVMAKTNVLSEPQWLINIGGKVLPGSERVKPPSSGGSDGTTGAKTGVAAGVGTDDSRPADSGQLAWIVEGGIAVPFYVVLLAMFGAGINMTLKVPEIQRRYEDVLIEGRSSSWFNPVFAIVRALRGRAEAPPNVPRPTAGDIRRELIENYMYLLSAPFLAVAMYYLLQVLAEKVTQPVLVLMAFATGLVSKAVIGGIIAFAESKLPNGKRPAGEPMAQPTAEVAAKTADAKARQDEADAAARALDEARARQTAAETAAEAAEEAAQKAEQKRAAVEAAVVGGGATQIEADTAKDEAQKAAQEAAAKQAEAAKAAEEVGKAAQAAESKRVAVQAAVKAAEEPTKEASEKQAQAEEAGKPPVRPTQAAAQEGKEKDAEAEAPKQSARETTVSRPEGATEPTKKD